MVFKRLVTVVQIIVLRNQDLGAEQINVSLNLAAEDPFLFSDRKPQKQNKSQGKMSN